MIEPVPCFKKYEIIKMLNWWNTH